MARPRLFRHRHRYCNKRELCRLLRDIDPTTCYILPDDRELIASRMDGEMIWVLKQDKNNLNLHAGQGVSYIGRPDEIPEDIKKSDGYLVMP